MGILSDTKTHRGHKIELGIHSGIPPFSTLALKIDGEIHSKQKVPSLTGWKLEFHGVITHGTDKGDKVKVVAESGIFNAPTTFYYNGLEIA